MRKQTRSSRMRAIVHAARVECLAYVRMWVAALSLFANTTNTTPPPPPPSHHVRGVSVCLCARIRMSSPNVHTRQAFVGAICYMLEVGERARSFVGGVENMPMS